MQCEAKHQQQNQQNPFINMKIEETNSTCTCESYRNATIKYSAMLDEYLKTNEMLRTAVVKLQIEIDQLRDYIKYQL